ncbi:MAG: hypothetical protein M1831_005812 [Alyxoria varia]|nr:MAG: hypothetical protein M1831_005812 [Alyxoria varia]
MRAYAIPDAAKLSAFINFARAFLEQVPSSNPGARSDSHSVGGFRISVAWRRRDDLLPIGLGSEPEEWPYIGGPEDLPVRPQVQDWPVLVLWDWIRFRLDQDHHEDSDTLDGLVVLNDYDFAFTYSIRSFEEWDLLTREGRAPRVDDLDQAVDFDRLRDAGLARSPPIAQ